VAGETDDRLLAVLGEAAAVVDLDVERVHAHLGLDVRGFEVPLVDLDRPLLVVEPALLDAEPAVEPVVDQKPVRKEDVRLERSREVVADVPHVAGRSGDDPGERLATDALVGLAVGIRLARPDDDVVLLDGIDVELRGRHVKVGLDAENAEVLDGVVAVAVAGVVTVAAVRTAAEHVNDRILVAAVSLDGVVDLGDHQLDGTR